VRKQDAARILQGMKDEDLVLEEVLGRSVFKVRNRKLAGRLEILKILESVEPHMRDRFMQEGKMLAVMKHRSIPQVYDIIAHGDSILIRSEHIDGYSLEEVLVHLRSLGKKLPVNVADRIVHELSDALSYAHSVRYRGRTGIIHCDIKPANIMISSKGIRRAGVISQEFLHRLENGNISCHLIDFGIAQLKGDQKSEGTLSYMSRQQVEVRKLDWRTDVYQLGLLLLEMLSGEKPFSGLRRDEVLEAKKNNRLDIPRTIPARERQVILDALREKYDEETSFRRAVAKELGRHRLSASLRKVIPASAVILSICLVIILAVQLYSYWDHHTNSIEALVSRLPEDHGGLMHNLQRIQDRAFRIKYKEPLLAGGFRDVEGGPAYPSHLDPMGEWVLEGPGTAGGAFVSMLFMQSARDPELLPFAIEYAEPILQLPFEGASVTAYPLALLPAFHATGDRRYMDKLIQVADESLVMYAMRPGIRDIVDIDDLDLFLGIYEATGNQSYLAASEEIMQDFIAKNIHPSGFIFESAGVNATTPYGPIEDFRNARYALRDDPGIGRFVEIPTGEEPGENVSIWSRAYVKVMLQLRRIHEFTGSEVYNEALKKLEGFYFSNLMEDGVDRLLFSDSPYDTLALARSLHYHPSDDRLRMLLSFCRPDSEQGIISDSVHMPWTIYDDNDKNNKNQSLVMSDMLFLSLATYP